jgi:hypothetical protein
MRIGRKAVSAVLAAVALTFGSLSVPNAAHASNLDPNDCVATLDDSMNNPSPEILDDLTAKRLAR